MQSPIEAFVEWFESLPMRQREGVAELIVTFVPGYDGLSYRTKSLVDQFVARVRSYEGALLGVGAVVALRETIQLIFIDRRGTRASWDKSRKFLEDARAHFASKEGSENLTSFLEQTLREAPFNEAQWLVTAQKWQELIAGSLSNKSIDRWWQRPGS